MLGYHKIFSLVKPLKTIGFGDDLSNCSENLKSEVEAPQFLHGRYLTCLYQTSNQSN